MTEQEEPVSDESFQEILIIPQLLSKQLVRDIYKKILSINLLVPKVLLNYKVECILKVLAKVLLEVLSITESLVEPPYWRE